jgi:hypothetical protein
LQLNKSIENRLQKFRPPSILAKKFHRAIIKSEKSDFFRLNTLRSWAHVVKKSARESHVMILKIKNKKF